MTAQDKQDFIENWEQYANEFKILGHSAETVESFDEIKIQVEAMKKIINKVAGECYGPTDEEKNWKIEQIRANF